MPSAVWVGAARERQLLSQWGWGGHSQGLTGGREPSSGRSSGWGSRRARRLCSRAMASAECLHFSEPHWQVKYLLLMSQKRSP